MYKLIQRWIYGFVVIFWWICIAYTASAALSGKYLYAGIYIVLAILGAVIWIKVLLPRLSPERINLKPKYIPLAVFLSTGILLLNFVIQSILQYQSSQTNSFTSLFNYATYTTTAVVFLVFIVNLYTYFTQE